MNRRRAFMVVIPMVLLATGSFYASMFALNQPTPTCSEGRGSGRPIQVVAAENFWGSLAAQIGGAHANVTSIVTDPNVDPHSYEGSTANAKAMSNACLVIVNGAGYDVWALNLIAAAGASHQTVLNVQQTLRQPGNANPHFWYSPSFVNVTVRAVYDELVRMDPVNSGYYRQQYSSLNSSLWTSFMQQEQIIKRKFGGTPVASTESVFAYMANATGLNVVSPPEFMKAVAEGNDPSAQDVAMFQNQLNGGTRTVAIFVYNVQTVSPLTQNLLALAAKDGIPAVRISETVQPVDFTFQAWMQGEVGQLQDVLNASTLGK